MSAGYYKVKLSLNGKIKAYYVHRLVYQMFKGDIPYGMQVNHIDENRTNNNIDNLELLT